MKYRTVRRWRAAVRAILTLILSDVGRHKITACEDCLSGEPCEMIQRLLDDSERDWR